MKPAALTAAGYPVAHDGGAIIGTVHLVLAAAVLLVLLFGPDRSGVLAPGAWIMFVAFTAHNVMVYLMARRAGWPSPGRMTTWLDLAWYSVLVLATGHVNMFFLFYFFAILVAAFRDGHAEGVRITIAAALLYFVTSQAAAGPAPLRQAVLRAGFLLALGYMIARWGEANLRQQRRLALLREVSHLSNPRFGAERTITDVMEHVRAFFGASTCVVVNRRRASPRWMLRTLSDTGARSADMPADCPATAGPLMMNLPAELPVLYTPPLCGALGGKGRLRSYRLCEDRWQACDGEGGDTLAELLDASSFISVPLSIQNSEGRAFLARTSGRYTQDDLLFLCQVAAQVVPVLEYIYVLDRLATEAALRERRKISHDLHDTTIQPYIGLSLTLAALRDKTAPDNPLREDITALARMASQVVQDMRHYVGSFRHGSHIGAPTLVEALRQQVRQARQVYGIDIRLELPERIDICDRLAAAAVHLVTEGISNLRKHTRATSGCVRLDVDQGRLRIEIENPNDPAGAPPAFTPVSISERTDALGGVTRIEQRAPSVTVVCIDIPV